MDEIVIIVISIGGTSALWGIFIKLFGQGYLDKLNRDWKTKQEREIIECNLRLRKKKILLQIS